MRKKYLAVLTVWLLTLGVAAFYPYSYDFPQSVHLGLSDPADEMQFWLIKNRGEHPLFTYFFEPFNSAVEYGLEQLETGLLELPAISIILIAFLLAQRLANPRIALWVAGALLLIGVFDLWEEGMETLALILLSVTFSLLLGIPLGVAMAFSPKVEKAARPMLDAMQTLPTFVYLIPAILFFGVAGVPSLVATLIYAMPPSARLTYLGLRQVPEETIEAALAFGSTRRQMLWKVQLPMALPSMMVGVNQTIMMALSMVTIAALIGASGLGREVLFALRRLRVGEAMEAGLAIVAMAILLDRLTYALSRLEKAPSTQQAKTQGRLSYAYRQASNRAQAFYRALIPAATPPLLRRYGYWLLSSGLVALVTLLLIQNNQAEFPASWHWSIQDPVDSAVEWAQINLYEIEGTPLGTIGTGPLSDFITLRLLIPLSDLLQQDLPWVAMFLILASIAIMLSDWRLALLSAAGLLFIGSLGMWEEAMDTLSQVLIAVGLSVAIGLPLGVVAARSNQLDALLRPVLDTLQTIPPFIYLIPMIMLFNLGRVPGVMASILYALPPIIRLTNLGIRQVDATVMEAAKSFGSSPFQTLLKVQLPLALPAIMMGVNQTVMMVLAMVVVAGLVGGSGLGFEVVSALADNELGRGLEAGLAIVAMAVILDRITQRWAERRAGRLGV
jgi:glycine betaine/proline transport system permease protein